MHKEAVFRWRIRTEVLVCVLTYLEQPGNFQRCAFGSKLIALRGSTSLGELDNVERLKKARLLAKEFILQLDKDVLADIAGKVPPSDERCQYTEAFTMHHCLR